MIEHHIVNDVSVEGISPTDLYDTMKLRFDVFTGEQKIEWRHHFDGRDIEAETRHLFVRVEARIASYLRLSRHDQSTLRVERVATAPQFRGRSLATTLNRYAVSRYGHGSLLVTAESHLQDWYASFGFTPAGETFEFQGLPIVTMRRPGRG